MSRPDNQSTTNHPDRYLSRHYNIKPSRSSPTTSNQHLSIISLSKLKNYMPQNQAASKLLSCTNSNASILKSAPNTSFAACYKGNLDLSNPSSSSSYLHNHHEKLARAKTLSLSSNRAYKDTPTQGTSGYNQPVVLNQVAAVTQQEPELRQQHNLITDSRQRSNCVASKTIKTNVKRVESIGTVEGEDQQQYEGEEVEQQVQLLAIREERKRKKIDSTNSSRETREEREGGEEDDGEGEYRNSCSRNNMTPSSLLLLQNHNYIEQQQQQQRNPCVNYNDNSHNPQQERGDDSIGQSRITAENCTRGGATTSVAAKQSGDQPHQTPHCIESALSASSSLMLTNINQFKALDSIGNSSTTTTNNNSNNSNNSNNNNNNISNLIGTSNANIVDSGDYLANQDLNHIHNQLTGVDVDSINNLQQNYQQGLTTCDPKVGPTQFVHYSAQNNRLSSNNYHSNFQASMLEQQIKLENSRNIFEENNSIIIDNNHIQTGVNPNVESLTVARDRAQQQARTSINQFYNSHYNLMPTLSSKSTSPISSTSTPSPKTNAMHPNTSQHSNQIASSAIANTTSSSQIHLDHLNHHYMNNNVTTSNMNHQQHQVNQHYSYNHQQATGGGSSQHHLAMSSNDQTYAHHHHQQQQQQQHQLQQQHHQQQQQQQQQNIQSQQSIYHQLANNAANVSVNHIHGNTGNGTHYHQHLQGSAGGYQSNHLMSGAHQNHLNTAAAACAAAAVVSQTLKTVANQHSQQHHYGGSIANGFGATTGGLMNMTGQHHQQFQSVNSLNHNHHLSNQSSITQQHQQNLPVHHTSSIVTRKYQCKMCPQVFMSKAEMKYHNQNHMREAKPYKCLQCPKAFANSSYLSQHMRIHQGVKPYTCDICSRKFTQLSHLQQHKRTHTGDKPYKCNYMNCTKQFSQLSNLQSHSRCHQLDKPYKCNSCYKCFHDEQSLLEHIPRHLESKHLKKNLCIFCGSSYQQERGLVKHFQQYHTDKTPTLVAAAIAAGTTGNTSLIASLVSSTPSNVFATPSSGGSSSSSSTSSSSSLSSSGSLNVHSNLGAAHGASAAFGTNQY